ncbi:MAG: tol-pal system YbgF family protein [Prolixibacteraceae bacterium]
MANNLNTLIEKYILGRLKGSKLLNFQKQMNESPDLNFEVQFNSELAAAITEKDIMDLRSNMQQIFQHVEKREQPPTELFDLSKNLDHGKISKTVNADISTVENSLQFIHLENHKKTKTERIHQIKSELEQINIQKERAITDNELWSEISNSLMEKDVIELRNNLKQIAFNKEIDINDYELDEFIDQDLSIDEMEEINHMITEDPQIAAQVKLHKEINEALYENDVFALRSSIANLMEEEQRISYNELKRIDEYLLDYLSDAEQVNFETELEENIRLQSELALNEEVNSAVVEQDVMNLRQSMQEIIHEDSGGAKIRQFIPNTFKKTPGRMIGAAASIAAVISVGAMSLSQQKQSAQEIYNKAYHPYEAAGLYRSPSSVTPEIRGVDLYNNQKFRSALAQFSIVLQENPEHPMCNFYTGLSHQQLNEFNFAIHSYQKVIDEKDNLFIEQAEWYMALCYLRTDESKKAYSTFNKIITNNGYYKKDAKEIIKKLK